jgi:hypothetical protein
MVITKYQVNLKNVVEHLTVAGKVMMSSIQKIKCPIHNHVLQILMRVEENLPCAVMKWRVPVSSPNVLGTGNGYGVPNNSVQRHVRMVHPMLNVMEIVNVAMLSKVIVETMYRSSPYLNDWE